MSYKQNFDSDDTCAEILYKKYGNYHKIKRNF